MSHADLVSASALWLKRRHDCVIVRTELRHQALIDIPDVIGWDHQGISYVVECKSNLADFLRDAKKPHRQYPALGLGQVRYLATPRGLLSGRDLGGWGLLEPDDNGLMRRRFIPMTFVDFNSHGERRLLVAIGRNFTKEDNQR